MTKALVPQQGGDLAAVDILADLQIPEIAHGGWGRIARNHPKLSQQCGPVRGLVH